MGSYEAGLEVASNDPVQDTVVVPVHLRVYEMMHVLLDEAQTWVPRGGTLDFDARYINLGIEVDTVEVRFEGYLPGATSPAVSYVDTLAFEPGLTKRYYALPVPMGAPIQSGYTWRAKLIDPPGSTQLVSEDAFGFEVKPAMEGMP